jgi:putative DNA primase/helicase
VATRPPPKPTPEPTPAQEPESARPEPEPTPEPTPELAPPDVGTDERRHAAQAAAAERDAVRAQLVRPPARADGAERPPLPCLQNLDTILSLDPTINARIGFDAFSGQHTWDGIPTTDEEETRVNTEIQIRYELRCATSLMREAYCATSLRRQFHPVRDYLDSLVWDGVPRVDTFLSAYAGAEDTSLTRAMSRCFLRSACARIHTPGSKVDTVLILIGAQGVGKSSLFRALVPKPGWFSDTPLDLSNKDAYGQLQGVWLYELAELASMRARDAEVVKGFLSAQVDRFRPPYGRNVVILPRQSVVCGSTNEPEFLDDPTGARRFHPVRVGRVDLAGITRDRGQLWAEAYEPFGDAVPPTWWMTPEEDAQLVEAQAPFQRTDPWETAVREWLYPEVPGGNGAQAFYAHRDGLTIANLLTHALSVPAPQQTRAAAMRAAGILTRLGWAKSRTLSGGTRDVRWRRV